MSHIKGRLKQYKDKYSGCYKYAGVHVKVIQDMIEQLQADLEQDEKENGWTPVSERLPEKMKVTGLYNGEYFKAGGKPPSYKIGWNACIDEIAGGNFDD